MNYLYKMIGLSFLHKSILASAVLISVSFYYHDFTYGAVISPQQSVMPLDNEYGMTVEEFQKKIAVSKKPILVYFHADWCMPCIKMKPEMVDLGNEIKEYCELLIIDTDANPKIAEHFEINSLPMFVIYKNGKKSWEKIGLLSKAQVKAKVDLYKNN
ncbi:MAG: thioredoxin family protein [Bacteroidota bacterium]